MIRKITGRFYRALALVIVLTLALPWAAFADVMVESDAVLSSNVDLSQAVAGQTLDFQIKVWATNGDIPASKSAELDVANKYVMGADGAITADTTSVTTLNFVKGYAYSTCPTELAPGKTLADITDGCKIDPFIVNATLEIPSDATIGNTATLSLSLAEHTNNAGFNLINSIIDSDTVKIVPPPNTAPEATDDALTVNEDSQNNLVNVLRNDTDANSDDTLSVTEVGAATNGTSLLNSNGTVDYTPNANYFGSDSFTYSISDGNGGTDTGTVTVTVNAVNDAPSFSKGLDQTVNEDAGAQTVSGWATAIAKGPANESDQTVEFLVSNNNNALFSVQPAIAANGTLSYTAADNANGSATVSVRIKDNGGTANDGVDTSAAQTFTITVNAVNDAPAAANDSASTNEDTAVVIDVLANDSDIDSNLTVLGSSVSDPANGTAELINAPGTDNHGKIRYTPDLNYNNTVTTRDSFTYKATDGSLDSNLATVLVQVIPINDAPEVSFTAGATNANEGQTKTYTFSVSDPDAGDSWSLVSTSCGANGSSVANSLATTASGGSFDCTFPDGPASSTVSIQVKDSDNANSNTAERSVSVANVAPEVSFTDGATSADEGDTKTYTFSVTDPGADTWSIVSRSCGAYGDLAATQPEDTNKFACTFPDGPASSTVSIQVKDSDNANSNTAERSVSVANVAPEVSFTDGATSADEGDTKTYTFSVTDPGADTWSIVSRSCGAYGDLAATQPEDTNKFACTFPDGLASSTVSVKATDSDGAEGAASTQTVQVSNVKPTIAALLLSNNSGTACLGGNLVGLSFSFSDPAGANDTYTGTINWGDGQTTSFGTSFSVSEQHTYAPGTYTITVNVSDSDGAAADQASSGAGAVSLLYSTSGFLQPINMDGTSSFKLGSTIPVKIRVTDCSGAYVTTLAPKVGLKKIATSTASVNEVTSSSAADTGNVMRWDAEGSQYIFNLSTKLSQFNAGQDLTEGTYTLTVTDPSFTTISVNFKIRK